MAQPAAMAVTMAEMSIKQGTGVTADRYRSVIQPDETVSALGRGILKP